MMAPPKSKKMKVNPSSSSSSSYSSSQSTDPLFPFPSDDDDFQNPILSLPLTQASRTTSKRTTTQKPLKPSNSSAINVLNPPSQKPKQHKNSIFNAANKENIPPAHFQSQSPDTPDLDLGLDFIESSIACTRVDYDSTSAGNGTKEVELKPKGGAFSYSSNSIESRLLKSGGNFGLGVCENDGNSDEGDSEDECELDVLLKLCSEAVDPINNSNIAEFNDSLIQCPLCGVDISGLSDELRQIHTNECLDKGNPVLPNDDTGLHCAGQVLNSSPIRSPRQAVDVSPVLQWLRSLGLAKYEENFVREEIDWDSLQWLTDEDLLGIGVTALGPRKKIIHALIELRKLGTKTVQTPTKDSKAVPDDTAKLAANKLITDYFPGSVADKRKSTSIPKGQNEVEKGRSDSGRGRAVVKNRVKKGKFRDIPVWCCIPGTPFRVDAFKYLRRDCCHWFLTHFHLDHYQGLTRSFSHGKIYCSSITAQLVNLKIGVPWDNLQVLPLNQKISIAGIDVTCFDANHCPGSVIILFEPPGGKAVLHTGDFRFDDEMTRIPVLQQRHVDTLILDTTYCDPQYDFPKQEAVIQFVIEVIQAEAFNPRTLFLIGSYTIGKERLFIEVARVLRKKIYVNAAKLRLLECLGLPKEDMQWFTLDEQESHIHVVPMWTLASFKRLKYVSNQYMGRFSLIVAFSPTGWTFGKGKKKSPGRRWQQGTIVRYEVPYSEHSSFTELQEFVKFISPVNIIPSVNNNGPESTDTMVSLLTS